MRKLAVLIVIAILAVPTLVYAAPRITGADVVDDSLTGADTNESTLGKVPSAAVADRLSTPIFGYTSQTFVVPPIAGHPIRVQAPAGRVAIGGYATGVDSTTTVDNRGIDHYSQEYFIRPVPNAGVEDEITLTVVHAPEGTP